MDVDLRTGPQVAKLVEHCRADVRGVDMAEDGRRAGCPGSEPLSYQLVTPGWLSGGTASVPFRFRPSEMILACTLIAGMSMLTGLDEAGRGPSA